VDYPSTGIVGFFGDANLEHCTVGLISGFVKNSGPDAVQIELRVDDETFAKVLEHKECGNKHFQQKNYEHAIGEYDKAVFALAKSMDVHKKTFEGLTEDELYKVAEVEAEVFDDYYEMSLEERLLCFNTLGSFVSPGDLDNAAQGFTGLHREELVKLLSNKTECLLQLKAFEQAIWFASQALALEPNHEKTLIRRAKAGLKIENRNGVMVYMAYEDLKKAVTLDGRGVPQARKLLKEATAILEDRQARYGRIELTDFF
jgi:tetratricopeptide (TPR) repeat protein